MTALLAAERERAHPRHVVVLALDGVPLELARVSWSQAHVTAMRAVFPTTSSAGWLSSTTGLTVDEHGVPGVVFTVCGRLIDVFQEVVVDLCPIYDNLFGDATRLGYAPLALLGDLQNLPGRWRNVLLAGARQTPGPALFTRADGAATAASVLRTALVHWIQASDHHPKLVWCHVDIDAHIHRHGYDAPVQAFLEAVDRLAGDLADRGAVVIAYSDHGLVPTTHDSAVAGLLERAQRDLGCRLGGAGRTRWLYTPEFRDGEVRDFLAQSLPASIRILTSDEVFDPGGQSHSRVGSLVLVAEGEGFLVRPGDTYEHGSTTSAEVDIPLAQWGGI
ncbi:alkaline phosphatase family protein [Streptomyces sp. NPDC060028]|uniref:alkaline phosphatase family protein n=1 Tax=Streptomyces sp. NPDC060028 TaxID=3347041 RepID=UPI0036CB9FA1